ncbi:mitochondrial phenylalanyl-tRNA synthetase (PheRS) [Andalucia godoyi]|uniref:phenylalanine--tRNA ligase n=1 Tax=Andalucia godoyi TaxID=505711 RepID=A0A8K0AGC2_ANDGO|nr:mitochondrial phenylalanyl-tRNA synthetase (PheRS) [Andalucia godoyi]|eukprot:ANDGO_05065.mRNA.1 mitochondrial phenylalanyl-tRNA synthetase (PheRS)
MLRSVCITSGQLIRRSFSSTVPKSVLGVPTDHACNISESVASRVGRNLHLLSNHPLSILRSKVEACFPDFNVFSNLPPVVSVQDNFDRLLFPKTHISRSQSDTYYVNENTVLRTHTSAHQYQLLSSRKDPFLVIGDVFRRDEIDQTHYMAFHQCEGLRMFPAGTSVDNVVNDLKTSLERLCRSLFGMAAEMRWVDAYFPFTDPSFELEVFYGGKWMECLGCGVVHRDLVKNVSRHPEIGWAFGLGLERLAMVLFEIPDIRLFWSNDSRFLKQFEEGKISKFQPFSKYPACYKDISFWLPQDVQKVWSDNDFFEVVRSIAGDLAESVVCIDQFTHPMTGQLSKCFRINYCAVDKTLTNQETGELQEKLRSTVVSRFGVALR